MKKLFLILAMVMMAGCLDVTEHTKQVEEITKEYRWRIK